MDKSTIFSKTAKGVREASGKTHDLSRDHRAILKEVDGKSTVEAMAQRLDDLPESKLLEVLSALLESDYVREFERIAPSAPQPPRLRTAAPSAAPKGDGEDLDFTSFTAPAPDTSAEIAKQKEKQAAEERARQEAAEKAKREAAEKARREAEEKAKREAAEKAKREAAEKAKREAEEKAKREAEEKAKREAEEKAKREAEEKAKREAEEKAKREAEEKAKREAEEKAKREAEEKAKREAEEKAKREAEEKAKREAEEKAKREAEEKAKREAEEKAKREAEEKAKREAEEKAKREAEEKAKREAEEKAKREAEEKAKREAEEKAKREAEEQARREAEEKAKREAEEKAKREAEEKARHEAEEKAKREAEERARREAEEKAKREAEEKARQEAEEKARREAEEKAKREAEEKARREAEEQAEREAEEKARREAEEKAKREAEEQAEREAEEQAEREAEEKARREAEEKAKREAEEQVRREAEEQAEREAEEKAEREAGERVRQEAEDQVRHEAQEDAIREAEERARQEAEAHERHQREAAMAGAATAAAVSGAAAPSRAGHLVKWGVAGLVVLAALGLGVLHVIPFDGRIPEMEKAVGGHVGQPVKIRSVHLSLIPSAYWRIEGVSIGAGGQVKVPRVRAFAGAGALLGGSLAFEAIELEGPVLSEEGLGWLLFGKPQPQAFKFARLEASNARLDSQRVDLPPLSVRAAFGADGAWSKMHMESADRTLQADFSAEAGDVTFEMSAAALAVPFGAKMTLKDFSATGTASAAGIRLEKFAGRTHEGTLEGNARLAWGAEWRLEGELNARQLDASLLAPRLLEGSRLEGKATYALRAKDAAGLFAAPLLQGSFVLRNSTLHGIDFARLLQGEATSGTTQFSELAGEFAHERGATQLRDVRLNAGRLTASGSAEIDAEKTVRGRLTVILKLPAEQRRADLVVSGKTDRIEWNRR